MVRLVPGRKANKSEFNSEFKFFHFGLYKFGCDYFFKLVCERELVKFISFFQRVCSNTVCIRNRPILQIPVPDWLITSQVT